MSQKRGQSGYRSLFWPIILIGVGITWLLINAGIISGASVAALLQLWPILLIAIGLDLLFGRSSFVNGAIIGIITVGILIGAMIFGPSLGLVPTAERQEETLTFATNNAESYELYLKSGLEIVNVDAGTDDGALIVADLVYYDEISSTDEGSSHRNVAIQETNSPAKFFSFPVSIMDTDEPRDWQIALNPNLPVTLTIESGVGELNVNLADIHLAGLNADLGVGEATIVLPMPQQSYAVSIDSGVGGIILDLPDDAAIHMEINAGVGGANVPDWLPQVSGEDHVVGVDGIWETEGFANADMTITVTINGGVGSVEVH
ncbi:MAG: hypothetical protein KC615_02650 [Anaerolineae bacterium]|nr:hypothetical protein [Anaerolineae bacterium]